MGWTAAEGDSICTFGLEKKFVFPKMGLEWRVGSVFSPKKEGKGERKKLPKSVVRRQDLFQNSPKGGEKSFWHLRFYLPPPSPFLIFFAQAFIIISLKKKERREVSVSLSLFAYFFLFFHEQGKSIARKKTETFFIFLLLRGAHIWQWWCPLLFFAKCGEMGPNLEARSSRGHTCGDDPT